MDKEIQRIIEIHKERELAMKELSENIGIDISFTKEETVMTEGKFNKVLLDLEIMGLIHVSWVTKENRRIEAVTEKVEEDEYEEQIKETQEKDYEASFPNS